jgi:hypothetical protein
MTEARICRYSSWSILYLENEEKEVKQNIMRE